MASAYRRRSIEDLESLNRLLPEMLCQNVDAVTPGDVQELIDDLGRKGRSASRVSSVVNALRALYRFARERELPSHDPARNVRLPLTHGDIRHRVVTPAEFSLLLKALWEQTPEEIEDDEGRVPHDALSDALAAYGTARAQEIEVLDWQQWTSLLAASSWLATRTGESPADPGGWFL